MQSSFSVGDLVEWPDADLHGWVRQLSPAIMVIEFDLVTGNKFYSFQPDGRIWEHCKNPQIRIIEKAPPVKPITIAATKDGNLYLYATLEDACSSGCATVHKFFGIFENDIKK
jgi:hypothetical protein